MADSSSRERKSQSPMQIFVLMGTAGCGKSVIAAEMQKLLNCTYLEGDSLHPQQNVEKWQMVSDPQIT